MPRTQRRVFEPWGATARSPGNPSRPRIGRTPPSPPPPAYLGLHAPPAPGTSPQRRCDAFATPSRPGLLQQNQHPLHLVVAHVRQPWPVKLIAPMKEKVPPTHRTGVPELMPFKGEKFSPI
ncbi:hypothetical protein NDU88_002281 [Pleurodeles waltl]|uniref:Uncharacterized protein n=1 Tax=Pleurodeles waltl TaxID=8319 RepID=A0AAV7RF02_PLEWA|nr:hypothetical protein NDU88_002281 [Pleurodeles waltl]